MEELLFELETYADISTLNNLVVVVFFPLFFIISIVHRSLLWGGSGYHTLPEGQNGKKLSIDIVYHKDELFWRNMLFMQSDLVIFTLKRKTIMEYDFTVVLSFMKYRY